VVNEEKLYFITRYHGILPLSSGMHWTLS